jgi:hypothetical protein
MGDMAGILFGILFMVIGSVFLGVFSKLDVNVSDFGYDPGLLLLMIGSGCVAAGMYAVITGYLDWKERRQSMKQPPE